MRRASTNKTLNLINSRYTCHQTMAAPKKYVKIGGVMKLNPEFKAWQESQTGVGTATSLPNSAQALPVVSSMEDHMQMNSDLGTNMPLAESTDATIEMMQEPEFSADAGMNPDTMVDELGSVLSKYEVPMGLMNKVRIGALSGEEKMQDQCRFANTSHVCSNISLSTCVIFLSEYTENIAHDALGISYP